jgi:hypothetical protein
MKKSELKQLIKEEMSKISKEENKLSSKQQQLLKDLYNTIKPYYQSLGDEQIIITLNELIDVYK